MAVLLAPSGAGDCIERCFTLDDLDPASGLAFGRAGRVGVDGRLTGPFLSFFHCLLELFSGGEEEKYFPILVVVSNA